MDVVVTGASGLIGSALVDHLVARGDRVVRLGRGPAKGPDAATWDPDAGHLDPGVLAGADAVVHLAGEPVAARRWSEDQKERILRSRTEGTALLARTIADLPSPPRVLVSASGIDFYGDRGDEILTEESSPGGDFLARVCVRWEAATAPAAEAGVRVAHLRTGVVLSARGGALARMLLPFRLGLGGRIGKGSQYMSWIALADEVAAIDHLLDVDVAGPVNLTSPQPARSAELTATLGRVLRRPTILPTPLPLLRLRYGGELVHQLLLSSHRVVPTRLEASGFTFAHPTLEGALRAVLDR